ncbi:MAG TPA: family 78 glycoside hydrolase catalytic domain [Vicinamibacteria bacterium]
MKHNGIAHVLGLLVAAATVQATVARAPSPGAGASFVVTGLETNGTRDLLGTDDRTPRFTWRIESDRRGVTQASRRVLVASRPELLEQGRPDVWDSGTQGGADPWMRYGGPPLRSRTRYHWTVRVGAAPFAGVASAAPAVFETALLDPSEWTARWIAGPARGGVLSADEGEKDDAAIRADGEFCRPVQWLTSGFAARRVFNNQGECREIRPAPMLRKAFRLAKPVARARLYASGLAYAHLTVNGERVGASVLDPGFTDYSRTVLYTTHDVTRLLRSGQNVVAAELGSGQFDSAARTWDWGWDQAEWRATPQMILQLHVIHTDGSEQTVASDASWKASVDGPRRYDSYYLGETYDARREIAGWNAPGFDDAAWMRVRVVEPPAGVLRAQAHEPIAVVSERPVASRAEPAPGVFVHDVGQNLTGWAVVSVQAPAGTPVELFYSEKLGPDGKASTAGNDLVFGQLQTDYYVARGGGTETWTPRFTYKGFQYLQVSAPGGAALPGGVRVTVERIQQVRSALARTSEFETDQPTLNRIHRNTVWAVQNNLHGVITDTPVYEKNAWTGDAQLTAGTASLLFDTERLYRKLFQDMRDAQSDEGEVPLLAPSNQNYGYVGKPAFKPLDCCGATPAWDAFWFVIPWEAYRRYGDRDALERTYPVMRRYLDDWVPRWTGRDGDTYAHTLTAGLGDWVPPREVPTVNALVSTAYYAEMARIAAAVARELGRPEEAARDEQLFARIRADFNARFLSPAGSYREREEQGFVQTAQILPLAFALAPDERRAAIAARLAEDITGARGGNAWVGVIGARYVLPVLTATGHHDAACQAATQTDEPSWGYWTDVAGFTALGEHWPADTRSRNHHFFGTIVQWLYEDLAGIRPLEPGYRKVELKPAIPAAGIGAVSASYESVRGTIASRWRRRDGGLEWEVVVPANATARVHVPAGAAGVVREGAAGQEVPADRAEGVRLVGAADGRVVYEVGSGRYRFQVR